MIFILKNLNFITVKIFFFLKDVDINNITLLQELAGREYTL